MNKRWILMLLICGSPVVNAANVAAGKVNYDRYCASCHGFNGVSVAPETPNLAFNQNLLQQQDVMLIEKLKMGGPRKPPFLGLLKDDDLRNVLAYSRTLR